MELVGKKDFVENLGPNKGSGRNDSELDFKTNRLSRESLLDHFLDQRKTELEKVDKIREVQNIILAIRSDLGSDRDKEELNHCLKTLSKVKFRLEGS